MGELIYFLGLKIKQCRNDIFINQTNTFITYLKRFNKKNSKAINALMSTF